MRRGGRNRKKFTWFPISPTTFDTEGVPGATWFHNTEIWSPNLDRAQVSWVAVLNDQTPQEDDDPSGSNFTLRDKVEGQEYIIERIVGKTWATVSQSSNSDDDWRVAIVANALAVLPFHNDGSEDFALDDINPLVADNADKPFIWRRTATLWNNVQPQNNLLGPTNMQNDGPEYGMVDARSVRRVHKNERLVFITAVQSMENIGTPGTGLEWSYGYDLRILGAMRRARNTSTFV